MIGNSLLVFGGYGGPGFSRRDFNDVYVSSRCFEPVRLEHYVLIGTPEMQPEKIHE